MSDVTTPTPATQVQSPAPEPVTEPQAQAQPQGENPEQPGKPPRKLQTALERFVKAYGKGESSQREWLLKAGVFADEYTQLKVANGHSRGAVTTELAGIMSGLSGRKEDPNRLMRAAFAVSLLAPGDDEDAKRDACGLMPYRTIRDALSQLVERDEKSGVWQIKPSVGDAKAREVFTAIVERRIDRDGAVELVKATLDPNYVPKVRGEKAEAPAEEPAAETPKPAEEPEAEAPKPLIDTELADSPEALAQSWLDQLKLCDEPDEALAAFLRLAKKADLSKPMFRVLDAALGQLAREDARKAIPATAPAAAA